MPPEPRPPPATPRAPRRRLPLAAVTLAAALIGFGWGVVHLFELRFAGGDVFPPYSTLRRDPLGAAVFHDALAALPDLRVERNLRSLASLAQPPGILFSRTRARADDQPGPLACFYLGANAYQWPYLFRHAEFERLETLLQQGGRVVITFLPGQAPLTVENLDDLRRNQSGAPEISPSKKGSPHPPADPPARRPPKAVRLEDLVARWGIDFRRVAKTTRQKASPSPTTGPAAPGADGKHDAQPVAGGPLDGAGAVSWHSVLDFDLDTPGARTAGWQTLYRLGERPVIIARPVGRRGGELMLASDSYFLSNEALRAEERPALLASLVGPARRVIFDETHLGITEQPGMMTLARRYGLQGGLAALGLLAVLFIWRNVVSLVPPSVGGSAAAAHHVAGRDAAAGFLNLLRRGVPPRDVIATCFACWQHALGSRVPAAAQVERLRVLAADESARRSPASAYRAMCAVLRRQS